jgi:putative intracellular protease/amidase
MMKVAIPLYDRFTALDAVGPYEVVQRIPGAEITWLAHAPGLVGTDTGQLRLHADAAFEELPDPDILIVPGGTGTADFLEDEATSHWLDIDALERYGASPTDRRVVEQGKVITAAGVSSGIDMALVLAAKIGGPELAQAIQLGIEYDPQPPFDSGSVEKASPEIVELVRAVAAART